MVQQGAVSSGSILLPKYQILMELGTGGMGQVHLAMSCGPRGFVKLVVLKSLKAELRGDDATYRMFHEEARISARLAHPNLVQTYEVTEIDGNPAMVLEYIEGQSLASILEQAGQNLTREMHVTILTKVLSGLHAAHELRNFDGSPLNLVHRDISPQNLMLQFDGQVKVLDFGIAKTERSVATEIGILKGKIRYMAPEQLVGDDPDRRVDVFAVGIMLWEALAQTRLWGDLPDGDIMRGLLNDGMPRLPDESAVPKELVDICYRAIAIKPDQRYATASEFLRDLEGYLNRQGALCSAEQLGSYLVEHFGPERQRAQRVISAHIEAVEDSLRPPRPKASEEITAVAAAKQGNAIASGTSSVRRVRLSWRQMGPLSIVAIVATIGGVWSLRGLQTTSPSSVMSVAERTSSGAAVTQCSEGTKSCDGRCVTLDRAEYGCGSTSCQPCGIANATFRCNQRNECDIAVCYQAYDNCDGDAQNGCETNIRIDPDHCGGCRRRCPDLQHAQRGCGDACTIWRCQPGYRDCNAIVADGCEVAVMNDRRNCGHCGLTCPAHTTCREGKCRL